MNTSLFMKKRMYLLILISSFVFFGVDLSEAYQLESEIKPIKIYGKKHPLVGVRDVILHKNLTFVLTSTFPAVHVFSNQNYWIWGKEGNGPMEFQNPSSIELVGDTLFILDFQPGNCKIVAFTIKGEYLTSLLVREAQFCHRFEISDNYKIVGVSEWGSTKTDIIVVKNGKDALLTTLIKDNGHVELSTSGPMKSFGFQNPFVAQPLWTTNNNGEVIFWDGKSNFLKIINIETGKHQKYRTIKNLKIPIKTSDVNKWIEEYFSSGEPVFGYTNFFENVREEAKENMNVPDYYPLITNFMTGPKNYLWLKRTYYREKGEIWTCLKGEEEFQITIPNHSSLIDVGKNYIAALKTNKKGVELLELYNKNEFF